MSGFTSKQSDWLAERHQAVLITLRGDGSAQSSNIAFCFDASTESFRISVTDDRAKTRNLRRDPRATLHVLGRDFWSFASIRAAAELSPITAEPGDEAGQLLLATYEAITAKPHPDRDEFYAAMVAERRLVITLHAESIAAQLPD